MENKPDNERVQKITRQPMTDTELQIAVAEKAGCKWIAYGHLKNEPIYLLDDWDQAMKVGGHVVDPNDCRGKRTVSVRIPRYPTSIDAIRIEVLKQSDEFQTQFGEELFTVFFNHKTSKHIHQLTAADWSECFLEAWEKIYGQTINQKLK
jgi:hypothetical protein